VAGVHSSRASPKEARRSIFQGRLQNPREPAPRQIEDAVVRAVIHDDDGIKLQVDVVGLDLTALIGRGSLFWLFARLSDNARK
jgi:hypothetical protein